jgi:hypothetical protein
MLLSRDAKGLSYFFPAAVAPHQTRGERRNEMGDFVYFFPLGVGYRQG